MENSLIQLSIAINELFFLSKNALLCSVFNTIKMIKYQWKPISPDEKKVRVFTEKVNLPPLLCTLLVERGISEVSDVHPFLYPKESHLHDPFLIKDMEKVVERINVAMSNKERLLLYGDYDVDGTTSIAIAFDFIQQEGVYPYYYIPNRYKEGYGLTNEGVAHAIEKKMQLVIAMDCGINAHRQAEKLKEAGIDLIIVDHHLPEETLPDAYAIINPKQKDCSYPFKDLSAGGLVFKVCQAYAKKYELPEGRWRKLLEFVGLSTACDLVPMLGENRVLAKMGVEAINQSERPGIKSLIRLSKRGKPLKVSDLVFGLGPLINAAGRLADANKAVSLLLAHDKKIAADYGKVLEYRNKLRREFDSRMFKEAKRQFEEKNKWEERESIVVSHPHWHKGVAGIVASRLAEEYQRPAVVLTESEGFLSGSCRSYAGINIHEALVMSSQFLLDFGGHRQAAGLRMKTQDLDAFEAYFEGAVHTIKKETPEEEVHQYLGELEFSDITPTFLSKLAMFAPFGPENRNPVFVSRGVRDSGYSKVLKGKHLSLSMKQGDSDIIKGIAFDRGDFSAHLNKPFDVYYTIAFNQWKGKKYLQLMVKDLRVK